MRKTLAILVSSLALLATARAAGALGWDDLSFALHGDYRFRTSYEGKIIAFETPSSASKQVEEALDSGFTGEHRIRIEPKLTILDQVTLEGQVDVLDGLLFADTGNRDFLEFSDLPSRDLEGGDIDSFHINRAWGEWKAPFGVLRIGRQPSTWGLGMLSNSGDGYDVPFGDKYLGDTSDRVAFGTKPVSLVRGIVSGEKRDAAEDPLTLALAYDWHVDRDAYFKPGDEVSQIILALLLEHGKNKLGVYAVRRDQEHNDTLVPRQFQPPREFLEAWVLDTTGQLAASPGFLDGTELRLEWEAAWVTGDTNLTVSRILQTPDHPFPESDVNQLGWVVRLAAERPFGELTVETGYASGDGNRLDDKVKDFRFHPDYNVGLILFEDLGASMTAAETYNLVHQLGEGGPVPFLGANYLVTNGSVTNAVYALPTVRVKPIESLQATLGLLWARALQPMVDPFNDALLGSGAAGTVNPYGGNAFKRDLGWEVDLAANYTIPTTLYSYEPRLILGIEYGHLFPGNAFENARGQRIPDIDKVRLKATVAW